MDGNWKHTAKVLIRWFTDNKVNVSAWSSQSPDLNLLEKLVELKRCVGVRLPTNLTVSHQFCREEWAKVHKILLLTTNDCVKLLEKMFV